MDNHDEIFEQGIKNLTADEREILEYVINLKDMQFVFSNFSKGQDWPEKEVGLPVGGKPYVDSEHFDNSRLTEGIAYVKGCWDDLNNCIKNKAGSKKNPVYPILGGATWDEMLIRLLNPFMLDNTTRLVRLKFIVGGAQFMIPLTLLLHAVQDFYSHTNWVDEQVNNKVIETVDFVLPQNLPNTVPSSNQLLLSGTYPDDETTRQLIKTAPNHADISKDNDKSSENVQRNLSKHGSEQVEAGPNQGKTYHSLAVACAVITTTQVLSAVAGKFAKTGSYRASTSNVKITLYGTPNIAGGGTGVEKQIDITNYDGVSDIENDNGEFKISDNKGNTDFKGSKYGSLVPNGSYLQSTNNVRVVMTADCVTNAQDTVSRTLDITNYDWSKQSIINNDGKLTIQ